MLKHFASRQVQPENSEFGHVIDQSGNLGEGQLFSDPVLVVVGIGIAVAAMEVASVRQFELRVGDVMGIRGVGMYASAELAVSHSG
ncbi:MAG: hypothetical protein CAF42_008130 [Nitrospira sp. CG24B]|nr:MAG: hypothetical protein CAF42_008130 [Nitrospira sp. CG24B]